MKKYLINLSKYLGMCVLSMGISSHALADVIFSNFGPGYTYNVSSGNVVGDGFDGSIYSEGDSFAPIQNAVFGSLRIALSEVFPGSQGTSLTISLTADSGNAPGAVLESWLLAPGSLGLLGNNNAPVVLNSSLNLMLLAGTEYWITASLGGMGNAVAWNWNSIGDMNAHAINDGSGWFSPSGMTPGAFEVDSAASVPEPSTLALFGVAFAGIAARSRRKPRHPGAR
ncbi:PEP-CTERM sorting domain-containing protein [Massilia sp. TW-1]|uniref:PEP-CTERM sorting domain-containing protein n=1 Tax=Telluria antibiotica TaxID=2717319 RepID=A0ABX0PC82_9BURK|nr:PEP-CTERM sorting domain-containing protein [Telluria antibiotica]NIA54615.1 PEP-CTERM sorting domain-containing protein [Telluria antibiotica]